jgi:hypothetical protein
MRLVHAEILGIAVERDHDGIQIAVVDARKRSRTHLRGSDGKHSNVL